MTKVLGAIPIDSAICFEGNISFLKLKFQVGYFVFAEIATLSTSFYFERKYLI